MTTTEFVHKIQRWIVRKGTHVKIGSILGPETIMKNLKLAIDAYNLMNLVYGAVQKSPSCYRKSALWLRAAMESAVPTQGRWSLMG